MEKLQTSKLQRKLENNLNKTLKWNWVSGGREANVVLDYTPQEYTQDTDQFKTVPFTLVGKNKHFKTFYRKDYSIILKLKEQLMVASIELSNQTCNRVNISFSVSNTSQDSFTLIEENHALSHNRVNYIKTGCFEAKYIKLDFT